MSGRINNKKYNLVNAVAYVFFVFFSSVAQAGDYTLFESGQVRPLAMSPDGRHLYVLNTPDNHLEIFRIKKKGLVHKQSVPVGMEPVAVAVRNRSEVWVVNHLSDSISIINTSKFPARVVRTLLVGDEPRDIVFSRNDRAFITTAHRGQNSPVDPQFFTPGIPRADVWVFDANKPGKSMGGSPIKILSLFTDTPRALALSPDGNTVYAAGFHTGNKTTIINEASVCNGGALVPSCQPDPAYPLFAPGGLPAPNKSVIEGLTQPEVGLIVQHNGVNWVDELGRVWDDIVRFNLPDKDVFAIDANATPPRVKASFSGVGTVLFNMLSNPRTGKIYVSNTEANNAVRFEGARPPAPLPGHDISTVQGNLHRSQLSIIDPVNYQVSARHLNKHINYRLHPSPPGTAEKSLATPMGMAISRDGKTLYIAAFGSSKVGVFNTAELEQDTFVPGAEHHIELGEGGPSGLLLDERRKQLYVMTRFKNRLLVYDINTNEQKQVHSLHNPEPASVINGRYFLYDARLTSSNGESSCSSCHVFGDLDSLAWDLGDPMGTLLSNPGPFIFNIGNAFPVLYQDFHPMKGPMATQSLRGLANHGPMHWRGDRTGGNDEPSVQPDAGSFNESVAFKKFNVAFKGLLGREGPLSDSQMQAFTDFILQLKYPPNPVRNLDNSLTANQQEAREFFFGPISDGLFSCGGCHVIDEAQGFFGTDGRSSFESETQHLKIPHLRNIYQKVGMFGMGPVDIGGQLGATFIGDDRFMGDQIRGFGFTKNGSVDTLSRFHSSPFFDFPEGQSQIDKMSEYLIAFDNELKPVVGQQITLNSKNKKIVASQIRLLVDQASAGHADLIVKAQLGKKLRGWVYQDGLFKADSKHRKALTDKQLRRLARKNIALTYTAVPPGNGIRMGIDRDADGILDGDEKHPFSSQKKRAYKPAYIGY